MYCICQTFWLLKCSIVSSSDNLENAPLKLERRWQGNLDTLDEYVRKTDLAFQWAAEVTSGRDAAAP